MRSRSLSHIDRKPEIMLIEAAQYVEKIPKRWVLRRQSFAKRDLLSFWIFVWHHILGSMSFAGLKCATKIPMYLKGD